MFNLLKPNNMYACSTQKEKNLFKEKCHVYKIFIILSQQILSSKLLLMDKKIILIVSLI